MCKIYLHYNTQQNWDIYQTQSKHLSIINFDKNITEWGIVIQLKNTRPPDLSGLEFIAGCPNHWPWACGPLLISSPGTISKIITVWFLKTGQSECSVPETNVVPKSVTLQLTQSKLRGITVVTFDCHSWYWLSGIVHIDTVYWDHADTSGGKYETSLLQSWRVKNNAVTGVINFRAVCFCSALETSPVGCALCCQAKMFSHRWCRLVLLRL